MVTQAGTASITLSPALSVTVKVSKSRDKFENPWRYFLFRYKRKLPGNDLRFLTTLVNQELQNGQIKMSLSQLPGQFKWHP